MSPHRIGRREPMACVITKLRDAPPMGEWASASRRHSNVVPSGTAPGLQSDCEEHPIRRTQSAGPKTILAALGMLRASFVSFGSEPSRLPAPRAEQQASSPRYQPFRARRSRCLA